MVWCYTYVVTRSEPANFHLLPNFQLGRDRSEHEVLVPDAPSIADAAEKCEQDD
jgi:hypothetical protein